MHSGWIWYKTPKRNVTAQNTSRRCFYFTVHNYFQTQARLKREMGPVRGTGCPKKFPTRFRRLSGSVEARFMHRVGVISNLDFLHSWLGITTGWCEGGISSRNFTEEGHNLDKTTKEQRFHQLQKYLRLVKSSDGLWKASKDWYQWFASEVFKLGFSRPSVCDCFFIQSEVMVLIIFFVDDLSVTGTASELTKFKSQVKKIFTLTNLGTCSCFLGLSDIHNFDMILLSQQAYSERLSAAEMCDCNPA